LRDIAYDAAQKRRAAVVKQGISGVTRLLAVATFFGSLLMLCTVVQGAAPEEEIATITITATRLAQPSFDVPASVNVESIEPDALGVNISESLQDVPGLMARERQNYAQDTQISIRGFGARASFGVRGIRIYIDGIPQTQPDGQGEVSAFNLASADRVEVLRGPFSALYGNSSGGVIQLFVADGSGPAKLDEELLYGSFDTWRGSADVSGASGPFSYNLGFTQFSTDGSRGHSAAQRTTLQEKSTLQFEGGAKLTVLVNYFNSPAQDPLGLTLAQFNASPQQTAPTAAQFNTRKDATQGQAGAVYELPVGDMDTFRFMAYGGERDILQFLAIPVAVQKAPSSAGSVVDLNEAFGGIEPRWTHKMELLGGPLSIIGGLTYDLLDEGRQDYNDFVGSTLGLTGPLVREESDDEHDLDEYLQVEWQPTDAWSVTGGVRHSAVNFSTVDSFVKPGGANGNGRVDYASTSPVGGLLYHVTRDFNVYASYGNGFETPTFTELAYRANGSPGINSALRAAHSNNGEIGAKARWGTRVESTLALFHTDSSDELAVLTNTGGRSTYTNMGLTRREGVELSTNAELVPGLQLQFAYTYLNAFVRTPYLTCPLTGCAVPDTVVAPGSQLPGVAAQHLFTALQWEPRTNYHLTLDDEYVSRVYANDSNSAFAGAYDLIDLAADHTWQLGPDVLRAFVRIDNLLNRRYAGSVIVNNSSAEYYEAGPGTAAMIGVEFRMM
jgi:iron complex outermembrane recepter protein